MKSIRNVILIFSAMMLAGLGFLLYQFKKIGIVTNNVASYDDSEIEVYKKVWSSINSSFMDAQGLMMKYLIIFWVIILISGYLFILLVYLLQIKPVKEMESFASEIAKGNLDTALPMHRENMFGGFTESFDLMREELRAAKDRELAAEHAKRELVAELSHDLKTPVATIQATCEVLEMKYMKERTKLTSELESIGESDDSKIPGLQSALQENDNMLEKIGYISNKSETINQLVQNVFRATLDDMDEIHVQATENDSKKIEGYFRGLKDYGNIILDNSIPECLVYMDVLRMEQVVDNIVGNSYKYAGTDIHVFFEELTGVMTGEGVKKDFIRIRIKDSGPGVPEEELPLVVEKYYRGSDAQEKTGYGLGLYLVKWYMEKQGGGMEYYNDDGFVVELLIRKV